MSGLTAQARLSSMARARPPLVHLGSGMKLKSEPFPSSAMLSLDIALLQPYCLTCLELLDYTIT